LSSNLPVSASVRHRLLRSSQRKTWCGSGTGMISVLVGLTAWRGSMASPQLSSGVTGEDQRALGIGLQE
jgi:hypothetical protein